MNGRVQQQKDSKVPLAVLVSVTLSMIVWLFSAGAIYNMVQADHSALERKADRELVESVHDGMRTEYQAISREVDRLRNDVEKMRDRH